MRFVPSFLRPFPAHFAILMICALPAFSQNATSTSQLPNAPSAAITPAPLPIVSGRPYRRPTAHENFVAFRGDLIGVRPFLSAGLRSGIEQARTVPTGWGQDFPGYMQRYGSAYGESAIDNTVRFGLAAAFHEDIRYLVCHRCSAHDKIENALLSEFTARHGADGHRAFSATPIIANFSGPLVAYTAWYPPGYGPDDAARHSALGFGTRIGFRIVREFLLDRDNKSERATKQASEDAAAAHVPVAK
jgi:hypothetical protein